MKERRAYRFTALLLVPILLFTTWNPASGSPPDADNDDDSLPQFSDWGPPENLGTVVNSTFKDEHPAISKNKLSLYITSNRPGGFGADDIWVSQRASRDDPWGAPVNLGPNINTPFNDRVPSFTPDGHWMLFGSNRPGGSGGHDLWTSHRKSKKNDFSWEPPINLGPAINSAFDEDAPTYFEDDETEIATLYFTSNRPGGPGGFDIYASTRDNEDEGTFSPALLVSELSSPARDTRTALRKDGLEMFLTSDRPGSLGGNDLWVSPRATTQDAWSTPVNLGSLVNSASADGAPALSRDSKTLIFFSEKPGGLGDRDLYVSTRTKLKHDDDDD